ncbi:hypothetical protein OIU79_008135 [Salix purpurea]|uniref:Uncharacterized protein n=1 Tax=Salix purpurea TaxID=77065 RepID=A0A9Q0YVM4_SALPP|nr:hypothetical protein OIU79_008135 [Salix purpurea]
MTPFLGFTGVNVTGRPSDISRGAWTASSGQVLCFGWKWNAFAAIVRAKLKSRQGVPIVGFTEMGVVEPTRGKGVGRDGVSLGEVGF